MKPLAPLPLCGVLMLTAGVAWFILRDREQREPSQKIRPPALVADKSIRERFLAAAADTDRIRRSARFAPVFRQLTAESAADLALEFWTREKSSPFQNDWYDFLRRWTELAPAGALAFAETNAGSLLEDWLLAIMPAWASVDRDAASQWWLTFAGPGREKIAAAMVGVWANQNWRAAAKCIETSTQGKDQADMAMIIAVQAVAVDASGVQAELEACMASGGSPSAIERALFLRLAAHKLKLPETGTLAWLANAQSVFPIPQSMAPECERYMLAETRRSPDTNEERGAWLTWLTEGLVERRSPGPAERLKEAIEASYSGGLGSGVSLFTNWLVSDTESASEWLGRQQGRACYDRFAVALVLAVARESPEIGEAWAMTVESPSIRDRMCIDLQQQGLKVPAEIAAAIRREGKGYLLEIKHRPVIDTGSPPPE